MNSERHHQKHNASRTPSRGPWETLFAGALGLLVALALAKLGNPAVLDDKIPAPASFNEFLVQPWPLDWGYALLVGVVLLSTPIWRWKTTAPRWVIVVPAAWFCWQLISATSTVNWALSRATLKQFLACVGCFCLGLFALSRVANLRLFWMGIIGGFLVVMAVGWEQHFGGLQRTRDYFFSLPDWQSFSPEFIKKVSSDRIYATLFYPNALAGAVLLLAPVALVGLWTWTKGMAMALRMAGMTGAAGLVTGCLFWSGSKAGWLILIGQLMVAFLSYPVGRRFKLMVGLAVAIAGIGGFWLKYRDYFEKGATSTVARLDYWRAASQTLRSNPLLGTGPGTFMVSYQKLKSPESEMARLAHNDFLQQGSDSGFPGMLMYSVWVWGSVWLLYRASNRKWLQIPWALWLGTTGFAVQSLVEFGLYIPALAWPNFLFLGWLWSRAHEAKPIDKAATPH